MTYALLIPFFIQGTFILIDEFYFHFKRKIGRWERIGHPLDTLTMIACFTWAVFKPYDIHNLYIFAALGIFSCIFITKDEWIHIKECSAGEMWTHAVLFLIHPIVLICLGLMWKDFSQYKWILQLQLASLIVYALYQTIYWNFFSAKSEVNNLYYNDLGDRWYKAQDDPIALLRAESKLFAGWIDAELKKKYSPATTHILDIGCGGGFLSNALAAKGWKITGADMSQESLDIAKKYDTTQSANYVHMNAEQMTFGDAQFDVVISLDMLEHVENPQRVISECSRVLKKNGTFFFHTFNRTFLGWLLAVKGIEWVFKTAPSHIHILRMFIKPSELTSFCNQANLTVDHLTGVSPKISRKSWGPLLLEGKVVDEFEFHFTPSTQVGYAGFATKQAIIQSGQ